MIINNNNNDNNNNKLGYSNTRKTTTHLNKKQLRPGKQYAS